MLPFAISCYYSPGLKVIKLSKLSLKSSNIVVTKFPVLILAKLTILGSELETQLKKFINLSLFLFWVLSCSNISMWNMSTDFYFSFILFVNHYLTGMDILLGNVFFLLNITGTCGQDPPPFFLNIHFFLHVNNILQLSMTYIQ